jgi:hypothetical protein
LLKHVRGSCHVSGRFSHRRNRERAASATSFNWSKRWARRHAGVEIDAQHHSVVPVSRLRNRATHLAGSRQVTGGSVSRQYQHGWYSRGAHAVVGEYALVAIAFGVGDDLPH